jgi:hypothetical protein
LDYWRLGVKSKVGVAEARGQFSNSEEMGRLSLEAVTRGLVRRLAIFGFYI